MRFKIICLILTLVLVFQIVALYAGDQLSNCHEEYWGHEYFGYCQLLIFPDYRDHRIAYKGAQEDIYFDYGELPWLTGELDLLQGVLKTPPRKDPFVAGLLSWFMMGVGQIYVHEYTKGSIFIAVDLTNKVLLLLLISHINSKYSPSSNEIVNVDWSSFDAGTKFLIIAYLTESLGIRIFSVVDAVQSAQSYNDRFSTQKDELGLSLKLNDDEISIGYNYWFSD